MALDLARLRAVMRGELTPKNGVTGVAGVAATDPLRQKSPELRQLRPLRVKSTEVEKGAFGGVAGAVAAALPPPLFDPERLEQEAEARNRDAAFAGLTDRWCSCGKLATLAVGRFPPSKGNPEGVARWVCSECFKPVIKISKSEG